MSETELRAFRDEKGRFFIVTKKAPGSFSVYPRPPEKMEEIARSCARVLTVDATSEGMPLTQVTEAARIWEALWPHGHVVG